MPYVGDYLGQLLAEIANARMQADLETVRLAELYAVHPLLRNMPVPRFRLPDIEIDVPIVVKQMEEPAAGELPRGTPGVDDMRKAFDKVLAKQLSAEKITLKPAQRNKLTAALNRKAESLVQPREVSVDVNRVADGLASTASATLAELKAAKPARQAELEEKLKEAARVECLKLRKPPTRLEALVTTAEIREAGPGEALTRIHLKITEEGFEWTTTESEGKRQERLVIE